MSTDSFTKALFHGVVPGHRLFPYPIMPAAERESASDMVREVQRFFERHVDSARIDREAKIPDELLGQLGQLGLFGLSVPRELGGLGLSHFASARVLQEVAAADSSIAVTLGAHASLCGRSLLLFGNDEQKARYVPKLARGECLGAFALTEPAAGSDAAGVQTMARETQDGFRLRGSKQWISNGEQAGLFVVFARTSDASTSSKPRLTAFLVERGEGVRTGPNEPKLGVRGNSTTELFLDDVLVPKDAVLGEVGRGFKVAVETLNVGRLGLAAGCVGSAKRLVGLSVEHAQQRRAFGRPIGEFSLIRDKVATMMAETFALESVVYLTCSYADRAERSFDTDYSVESAVCKVFGSETLWSVANESLQIAAGSGYMSAYPYERLLRDARVNLIFEGTNEILRCFIALAGMQGPGRDRLEVSRAMREPIKGFGMLSEFALQKAKSVLQKNSLTGAHEALATQAASFDGYVTALARQVQLALRRYGRNIAEMQFVLKRTADIVIQLYAIGACISRTTRTIQERGTTGAQRELSMTRIFCELANARIECALRAYERNDDDLRSAVASKAYVDRGYPLDVI